MITRWTPARKLDVLKAIRERVITVEEACSQYDLSLAELHEWQFREGRFGMAGLAARKLQELRA